MTDPSDGTVRLHADGDVATLLLDRPGKRNALSTRLLAELGERLNDLADDTTVRVVVVRGSGPVFCAGADTREFDSTTPEVVRGRWTRLGQRVFTALAELPQTTVAVLTGGAYGGGLELAMHCDFRVAAPDAVLRLPEATLGTAPGWSGLRRILETAGPSAARLMALTGRRIDATAAQRMGLVDVVAADLDAAVDQLVAAVLGTEPRAQQILKRALAQPFSAGATTALVDSLAGAYLATKADTEMIGAHHGH